MSVYVAKCHCGSLEAVCSAKPDPVVVCHCTLCRRRTGSYFHVAAWFPIDSVEISGEYESFTRSSGDIGLPFTFHYCAVCGTNLWWPNPNEKGRLKGKIGIAGGCFENSDILTPTVSIYEKHKESWVTLPESVERYESGF